MKAEVTVMQIKFPNGDVYHVPAEVIAGHRTEYYSKVDGYEKDSPEWVEEFRLSMTRSELLDWISNNMNWEDFSEHAALQPQTQITYDPAANWNDAEVDTL